MTINPTVAEPGGCSRIPWVCCRPIQVLRCSVEECPSFLEAMAQVFNAAEVSCASTPARGTFFSDERLPTTNCHTPALPGVWTSLSNQVDARSMHRWETGRHGWRSVDPG